MNKPSNPGDSLTPQTPSAEPPQSVETQLLIAEYLEDCRYRGLAQSTVDSYSWSLARLALQCPTLPADRRPARSVLVGDGLADMSRKTLRVRVNGFFVWAAREYGHPNPLEDLAKSPYREPLPRILSDEEIMALWEAAAWQRNQAMVALILDTGLRVGELAALRWADIGKGFLVVPVQGKTGSRRVPVSPNVQELMDGLGDETYIWVGTKGPLTKHGIREIFRSLFRKAGIYTRKNGPHTLRHAFASNYLKSGGQLVPLQKILGHRSIKTTMIYIHLAGSDVDQDHAVHSPIHRLKLNEKIKPVEVIIPSWSQPKLF